MTRAPVSYGILLLPPDVSDRSWKAVEVDAEVFDYLQPASDVPVESAGTSRHDSLGAALVAAYETLILITEGRVPAMHEYTQESVREFVQLLEDRGYDRKSALRLLTQMVDRMSDRSPVKPRPVSAQPVRRVS